MQVNEIPDSFQPNCTIRDEAIFATNIQTLQWDTAPGFNERLAQQCMTLYQNKIQDKLRFYEYNLWQEDIAELKILKKMFEMGIKAYIDAHLNGPMIREGYDGELHAWLRIDRPKQIISPHAHLNTAVAVTYYCQADIAARKIVPTGYGGSIIEGDLVLMDSTAPAVRYGKTSNLMSIAPQVGMMVIIPGHLMHWVNPVSSGDVRICIANNLTLQRRRSLSVPCEL